MRAALVPLALVPALGAVQGGFAPDSWVWSGALAGWAAAIAVVMTRSPGMLRRTWAWAITAGALLVWTLLSAIWSVRPSQSVLEARRMIVYAAVVLALSLLARRRGARALSLATHAAIVALLLYAQLRYLLGHRTYNAFEGFLINDPIGYANGIGILAALGLVLALGIAAADDARALRVYAGATVPLLALTLELSGSTASWLALVAGLVAAAVLDPAPLRLVTAIAVTAPPTVLLVWLGRYSDYSAVVATPRIPGYALVAAAAGAAAVAGATVAVARLPATSRRARRIVLVAAACIALAGAAAAVHNGATEPRASYWHVAWREYHAHPALGSGAGTFGYYWARIGRPADLGGALDAHSLYLETLAELGPLGLLLLVTFLLVPFRAVALRTLPFVPAALGAYSTFLVHAALDWDWELPVVVVAALCCGAAALAAGEHDERPLGRTARAAAFAAAVALAACAIAGAKSNAFPSAETTEAPSGASGATASVGAGYLP